MGIRLSRFRRFVSVLLIGLLSIGSVSLPVFAAGAPVFQNVVLTATEPSFLPLGFNAEHYPGVSKWSAVSGVPFYSPGATVIPSTVKKVSLKATMVQLDASTTYTHMWFSEPVVKDANGAVLPPKITPAKINTYLASTASAFIWSPDTARGIVLTPYYTEKWVTAVVMARDTNPQSALNMNKNIDDYTILQFRVAKYVPPIVVGNGKLTITTSADTPSSQTVPSGATGVDMFHFTVQVDPAEDVILNSIIVADIFSPLVPGPGTPIALANAMLYMNDASGLPVPVAGPTQPNTFVGKDLQFAGLMITLKKGQTYTFRVTVDSAPVYKGILTQHRLALIETGATYNYPPYGSGVVQATGVSSGQPLTSLNGSVIGATKDINTTVKGSDFIFQ